MLFTCVCDIHDEEDYQKVFETGFESALDLHCKSNKAGFDFSDKKPERSLVSYPF